MRAAWCSSRNHAAQKQDEQLLSCTSRNTEHRPSCQVPVGYKPPVIVKVIRVYRTTTQSKYSIDHHWDLFTNNGTGELPSCDSKLLRERASHTSWWYHVHHKTTQCNNKTNDCKATQSRPLNKMPACKTRIRRKRLTSVKANGMYRKTILCKYRNDRRWHPFANKKTPCQPNSCASVPQKSLWCGVCVHHRSTPCHM